MLPLLEGNIKVLFHYLVLCPIVMFEVNIIDIFSVVSDMLLSAVLEDL
jgi:hypothetical protein